MVAWFAFCQAYLFLSAVLDGAFAVVHRDVFQGLAALIYLGLIFVALWADRDRPTMKHHIEMNVIYMYATVGLLTFVLWFLGKARELGLMFGLGGIGSSIAVQLSGMLVLLSWDFISARASTLGSNAPFMFPLYFAIDITNALIFVDREVNSASFAGMLVVQACFGMVKNCGVYEICFWLLQKLVGQPAGKFPYRDKDVIEGLIVVSSVDFTSEFISAFVVLGIVLGERIGWWTNTEEGRPPCLISSCALDQEGGGYKKLTAVVAVTVVSFVFRFACFYMERRVFKWALGHSAKIESRATLATIDLKSLEESLKREEKQEERSTVLSGQSEGRQSEDSKQVAFQAQEGGQRSESSNFLKSFTSSVMSTARGKRGGKGPNELTVRALASSVMSTVRGKRGSKGPNDELTTKKEPKRSPASMKTHTTSMKTAFDLLNETHWVHHTFSKAHDVQVFRYSNPDRPPKEKEDMIFKTSVTLTGTIADLKGYALGYTDRGDDGSKREILEQIDEHTRILYRKLKFPPPFAQRDIVFFDILREFDGGSTFITFGSPTEHPQKPVDCEGDGTVRLTSFVYLQHFQETPESTPRAPQTQYTYIYSNQVDLFGVPSSILEQMIVHNMTKKVDLQIKMFGRVDESAAANQRFNEIMEKITMKNTLGRLFRGNKLFLAIISIFMIWSVIEALLEKEQYQFFAEIWNPLTCKNSKPM